MPTYTVFAPEGLLAPRQKHEIARTITRVHAGATGAPGYFAQVIFQEIGAPDHFVGGAPLEGAQIFVHGQIRDGRPLETKQAIIEGVLDGVATCAGVPRSAVWCYVVDVPASQMAEFGRILPKAGEEAAWSAALPEAERARIEAIGRERA